jgi:hypothetical protein
MPVVSVLECIEHCRQTKALVLQQWHAGGTVLQHPAIGARAFVLRQRYDSGPDARVLECCHQLRRDGCMTVYVVLEQVPNQVGLSDGKIGTDLQQLMRSCDVAEALVALGG